MAKVSKVEPCMFCGALPCECNKSTKKAAKKKSAKKQSRPVVEQPDKPSIKEAMKAATKPKSEPETEPQSEVETSNDEEFAAAIRALEPILHRDEKRKYDAILSVKESVQDRAQAWKARRHGNTE